MPTIKEQPAEPVPAAGPRVLVVSRCAGEYGGSKSGADVMARRHAALLAERGVDVVFVGTARLDNPHVETILVRPIDPLPHQASGSFANTLVYLVNEGCHVLQAALHGAKVIRRTHVDLSISNSSVATLLLRFLAGHRPIVHYVHDGLYPSDSADANRSLTRYVVNNLFENAAISMADQVICVTDRIAARASSAGAASDKLNVMYPLVPWRPSEANLEELSPSGQVYSRPYLLSVGQQTGRKRFDLLIRALVDLPEDLQLLLVGDGPMNAAHRQLADALGLRDRVVFLSQVPNRALDQLYRHCAAYVLASDNESFPLSVLEAATQGRPVVLACPTTPEWPVPPPNGHLIVLPELSVESLRRAIRQVLRDEPDTLEFRQQIRRWASSVLPSEEEIREKYQRIFRLLVPGRVPG